MLRQCRLVLKSGDTIRLCLPREAIAMVTETCRFFLDAIGTPNTSRHASLSTSPFTWLGVLLAVGLAMFDLFRAKPARWLPRSTDRLFNPVLDGLQALHSGDVRDYIVWLVLGLTIFAMAFEL